MSSTARTNRILLLVSENGGSTSAQQGNTRRCTDLLSAKKVAYDTVDGADAEQKEVRDRLFGISGEKERERENGGVFLRGRGLFVQPRHVIPRSASSQLKAALTLKLIAIGSVTGVRGNYPQMFVMVEGLMSKIEFLGSWGKIEEMNELNDLPEEVLTKNPELVTLDMVFKECETLE